MQNVIVSRDRGWATVKKITLVGVYMGKISLYDSGE
jgi:hypothetical protein